MKPFLFGKRLFTLIELLIVVVILLILASMLLPALERARESGLRAVCASNLNEWGKVAKLFAGDHKSKLPRSSIGLNGGFDPYAFTYQPEGMEDPANWIRGTPYQTWREYGLKGEVLHCPSSKIQAKMKNRLLELGYYWDEDTQMYLRNTVNTGNWRWPLARFDDYHYYGRLDESAVYSKDWGDLPPANYRKKALVASPNMTVLASCVVKNDVWGFSASHSRYSKDGWAGYQNIVYGDGHVRGWANTYERMSPGSQGSFGSGHSYWEGSPRSHTD